MGIDVLTSVIAGLLSLLGAGVASSALIQKLVRRLFRIQEEPEKPYSERLSELTTSLTKASSEVDSILSELAQVARNRESAVQKLETDLQTLESREKELKEQIEALENTPLPVAEHFAKLLETGQRRSAKRDYILFGAGVVATTIIAIIIQVIAG
jgi:chromosome segregation ATPase